jgi:hypothetical protein
MRIQAGHSAHYSVPQDKKVAMQGQLQALGVSWSTLFPDLDHLTRELRAKWELSAKAPHERCEKLP